MAFTRLNEPLHQEQQPFDPVKYFTLDSYIAPKNGVGKVALEYQDRMERNDWIPCHAMLNHAAPGLKGIYSSLWCNDKELYDAACSYWEFMLSTRESPWRSILKGSRIIHDAKNRPIAFYIKITDDTPSQLLADLCIASRAPLEHPGSTRAFDFFLKQGFSQHESLLLSVYLRLDDLSLRVGPGSNAWHFAFDSGHNIKLSDLVNGTPHCDWRRIKLGNDYSPADVIWNNPGKKNKTDPLSILRSEEPYIGVFKTLFRYSTGTDRFINGLEADPIKAAIKLKETRALWAN